MLLKCPLPSAARRHQHERGLWLLPAAVAPAAAASQPSPALPAPAAALPTAP